MDLIRNMLFSLVFLFTSSAIAQNDVASSCANMASLSADRFSRAVAVASEKVKISEITKEWESLERSGREQAEECLKASDRKQAASGYAHVALAKVALGSFSEAKSVSWRCLEVNRFETNCYLTLVDAQFALGLRSDALRSLKEGVKMSEFVLDKSNARIFDLQEKFRSSSSSFERQMLSLELTILEADAKSAKIALNYLANVRAAKGL